MNAYLKTIANAQHFIYIENQFFVSGFSNDEKVRNRIAEEIYKRISRAAIEKKPFRVIVLLPLLPAFEGSVEHKSSTDLRLVVCLVCYVKGVNAKRRRQVMYWQYRSISRHENQRSLVEMLQQDPNIENWGDYLCFFSLRKYDARMDRDQIATEMIYIHSKVMIVDDNVAIVGTLRVAERAACLFSSLSI